MRFSLILIILCFLNSAVAQEKDSGEPIFSSVMNYSVEIDCKNEKSFTAKYTQTIYVSNSKGFKDAGFYYSCNNSRTLNNFSCKISSSGNEKKYKKADLTCSSISSAMASDDYEYRFSVPAGFSAPATIIYEWTVSTSDGYISFPFFYPLNSTNRNVIACRYDLTYPADMNVRYRTYNTQDQVEITEMPDKKKKLSLKMINVQPVSPEPLSDIKMNGFPSLHVYPDIFYYNGKRCDASSWESLGKWQYESLKGLDALPEDIKRKVRQLTDSCSSDLSKVKVLYEFMNSTTRYVSIQLGIGGYIPFSASEVAKKGFGDCKALSNYMKALLKEADVFSEYCIVKSGATEVLEKDFVNFTTFNHAILKVPLPEKDIWLECTANIPVGYIHNGISGQDVLVVGKNGGRIEKIGVYDVAENVIYNTGLLKIDSSGNGSFEYSSKSALHNGHQLRSLLYADMNKKNNYVISALRHSNTRLDSVSITETREEIPVVDIVASAFFSDCMTKAGSRRILNANFFKHNLYRTDKNKIRKTDIFIDDGFYIKDSIDVFIPEGMNFISVMKDSYHDTDFGHFRSEVTKVDNHHIKVLQEIKINNGRYPKERYREFCDFINNIKNGLSGQVVLN